MFGPLRNPKHERFAQLMASGVGVEEAHVQAGFARNAGNARRLKADDAVMKRVEAIQARIDDKTTDRLANVQFDAIRALTEAATIAFDADTLRVAAAAAAERGDAKGMITAGIEALKLREVLTGGVSDRTAKVNDGLAEKLGEIDELISGVGRSVRARGRRNEAVVGRPERSSTH